MYCGYNGNKCFHDNESTPEWQEGECLNCVWITVSDPKATKSAAPSGQAEFDLLGANWRAKATKLREEATRIRQTVKQVTGAEERCNVRAGIYDKCADQLEAVSQCST